MPTPTSDAGSLDPAGTEEEPRKPKYEHPKILLLDTEPAMREALQQAGFGVRTGSLGQIYEVKAEEAYAPIQGSYELPRDYKERDIVVVDMRVRKRDAPPSPPAFGPGVHRWHVNHHDGFVFEPILNAIPLRDDFNRIVDSGGVFVVFVDAPVSNTLTFGARSDYQLGNERKRISSWDFLDVLGLVRPGSDHGNTVRLADDIQKGSTFDRFLSAYIDGMQYDCTLDGVNSNSVRLTPLLKNKFDQVIGGVIGPSDERPGLIFLFPNVDNKTAFIAEFFAHVLPSIAPQVFPEQEPSVWIHRPEYALDSVRNRLERIQAIETETAGAIKALQEEVAQEYQEHNYLYDLIGGTGDDLVDAVQTALTTLGFVDVANMDEISNAEGSVADLREDLQIRDLSPLLVCEVKGISYFPSDDDALAVQKYVVLRGREQQRNDVRGLTIINHQRHLPPLERENLMPFRQAMVDAAEEQEIGLLTTWDLHRLVKSLLVNNWPHAVIAPILYRVGRIQPIPEHYEYLGTIERYMPSIGVIGVRVESGQLEQGDHVAIEFPTLFREQVCESLQIDNQVVATVETNDLVGIEIGIPLIDIRVGLKVYLVDRIDDR